MSLHLTAIEAAIGPGSAFAQNFRLALMVPSVTGPQIDEHGSDAARSVGMMAIRDLMAVLTADGPVILLPDEGDGCKVAKLDDIERLREHTTFIAEDGEVSIRRYRPDEWRYALIDAVRMVAE